MTARVQQPLAVLRRPTCTGRSASPVLLIVQEIDDATTVVAVAAGFLLA
ncbi:MAG: hypothetical protein ACRYGH_40530 [Janthinobacterium lividum]